MLAYVNHGRWVADCPCGGAELVAPGEPMACGSCGLEHVAVWPADRSEIEGLLTRRPLPNQNWRPTDTTDMLLAENIEAGIYPEDF